MKKIKIVLSFALIFTLSVTSFAQPPRRNPPPPPHHHPHHYYRNDARDAVLILLGVATVAAVATAASNASKSSKKVKKQEEENIKEKYDKFSQDLTLTKEQQEKVENLFNANRQKVAPVRDEKDDKTLALETEKAKENPDETVINALENEISILSRKIYRITYDTRESLKTILTPAQYEAMKDVKL